MKAVNSKKWRYKINGDTFYMGERVTSDEVIADTEEKAFAIMKTSYEVDPKMLELIEVTEVSLYGSRDTNPVGFDSNNLLIHSWYSQGTGD